MIRTRSNFERGSWRHWLISDLPGAVKTDPNPVGVGVAAQLRPDPRARASTPAEFVSVAAGQVAVLVATAIAAKILTVGLGGTEYGRLTLGLTLAALLGQSIYGPLNSALARLWPAYREAGQVRELLAATNRVLVLITLALGLVGLVAAASMYVLGDVDIAVLIVGSLGYALLQNVTTVYTSLETSNRRRIWAAIFQSLVPISRVGFGAGVVLIFGGSAAAVAVGLAVGIALVLLAQQRVFVASLPAEGVARNSRDALHELWAYGRYFLGWGALSGLQLVSDVWALKMFTNDHTVGIYAVASLLAASTVASAGAVITQYVYPVAFQRAGSARSAERVWSAIVIIRKAAGLMGALSFIVLALAALFGRDLVLLVSTPAFVSASSFLPGIVLAAGMQHTANLLGLVPMIVADMRRYLILRVGTTILAILLNIIGTWFLGATGLVASLIVSSLVFLVGVYGIQSSAATRVSMTTARSGPGMRDVDA
jgi:O-antigen/teichoic acid export membrane protein